MKTFYLIASTDAINIDFSIVMYKKNDPSYWEGYEIARRHSCKYFYITDEEGNAIA